MYLSNLPLTLPFLVRCCRFGRAVPFDTHAVEQSTVYRSTVAALSSKCLDRFSLVPSLLGSNFGEECSLVMITPNVKLQDDPVDSGRPIVPSQASFKVHKERHAHCAQSELFQLHRLEATILHRSSYGIVNQASRKGQRGQVANAASQALLLLPGDKQGNLQVTPHLWSRLVAQIGVNCIKALEAMLFGRLHDDD